MTPVARIDISEYTNLNNVARWLITLRWIAAAGVFLVLCATRFAFPAVLPLPVLFTLNAALALLNSLYHVYFSAVKHRNLSKSELAVFFNLQICSDYLLLLLLLYFTGFAENPLAYFFVFHILLTAYIFSPSLVFFYVGSVVAIFAAGATAISLHLIPHYSFFLRPQSTSLGDLLPRTVGVCVTLAICGYLGTSIRKRLEEKAQRVEVELDRYKSLDRIKSNFLLQVTHELRGPLAAVKGYHEMIERGITGPVGTRTLETVGKATRRTDNLLTMIDEMIDYAYMQTDKIRFEPARINVRDLILANIEALSVQTLAKGMRVELKCAPDLFICASRDLGTIVLSNLLSNAVRYSHEGSTVTISAVQETTEVCLEVKDHGIGMTPGEMEHIFEEFYRTRRAREIERDGTGLGLSIIKKAVETIGGRITVASQVDRGSTFHIYFPRGEHSGQEDTHHRR
jgi:signal transduction histidine kinase